MDIKKVAEALNGCEYGEELSPVMERSLKDGGVVVVFGASDDLTEFRGAIHDEGGGYEGSTIWSTRDRADSAVGGLPRIACIPISYHIGEGLSTEGEDNE